jgi:hypothetical protein
MKKTIITLLLFLCQIILAQKNNFYNYPIDQEAYLGGNVELFKDIQDFLVKNNLSKCENSKEMYWVTLRIDENSKLALIRKKADIEKAQKNKCAYDLIVKALGGLKKWKAAEIKGEKVTAYFDFPFVPAHFFENYKEGYDTKSYINRPFFAPNGIDSFREDILKNLNGHLDFELYKVSGRFTVFFTIETDGSTKVSDIEPKVANSEGLLEDMKFAFKQIKQKWQPATVNGVPVQTNSRVSINFIN